jgi:hypothetical protein
MPSHGRRAGRGGRTPGTALRTRLATATSTRPIHPYPRLTSGQSLHSCALAHTGRVLFLGRPADPGPSCVRLSRQGGTRGGRLTAGESGRREAHSMQRDSPSQDPARRLAAGACGRWEPPVRCPARGASRLPFPLGITPTSFNATRRPRLGKPRVVAHCRLARPDATAVFLPPQVDRAPREIGGTHRARSCGRSFLTEPRAVCQ